jgi:hypothetical protein
MRKPWEPQDDRPAPSFSSLPQRDQDAMKARLEATLAELRSAVPANERIMRSPRPASSETQRKTEGVSHG